MRKLVKKIVKDILLEKHIIGESQKYDILYRGVNDANDNSNKQGLWLTTSMDYAKQYGNVKEYKIPNYVLDKLADEDTVKEYLREEAEAEEEYSFYDEGNFNLQQLKQDGYTGYYYHEDEYKCLNVFLLH